MVLNPNTKIPKYFKWALAAAKNSEHGIYKMGAVIEDSGIWIASGWNKNRTHPRAKNYTTKIHAELDALIRPRKRGIWGGNMYIVRITNGGAMATSKPCKDCMILIKEAGLASVTFIDEQGKICQIKM